MDTPTMDQCFPLAIFLVFVGGLLYRFLRPDVFRASAFGSELAATLGEVELAEPRSRRRLVRVHRLENDLVVVELRAKGAIFESFEAFELDSDQLRRFEDLLQQAEVTST